jgi:hypothetical protein
MGKGVCGQKLFEHFLLFIQFFIAVSFQNPVKLFVFNIFKLMHYNEKEFVDKNFSNTGVGCFSLTHILNSHFVNTVEAAEWDHFTTETN